MVRGRGKTLQYYDIQRFCVHDGPGIRTVVFFKGCPLRCRWCQNPESLSPASETAFYAERCHGCEPMPCAAACPQDAIFAGPGRVDRGRCRACGRCAAACPHEALRLIGCSASTGQVLDQILIDRAYFEATGGGVTLSGGEPLLQAGACADLLQRCRGAGLHTVVETSGAVPWRSLAAALPHTDLFLYDLKAGGEALHRELTGVSGHRVADNARRLLESGARVLFRMPVVPEHNDGSDSLAAVAGLLRDLGQPELTLLRYHAGGQGKLARIESRQPRLDYGEARARRALEDAAATLRERGITVNAEEGRGEQRRAPAPEAPERVRRLRRAVQTSRPAVCTERALLVTEFFRRRARRSDPVVVQKAEALRHLLARRRAAIHDDELLVGCFTSKRVGGSIFPELHGIPVLEDLPVFRGRQVNPLQIEAREALDLITRVVPFWAPRFLGLRAHSGLARRLRFVWDQLRGRRYLINESGGVAHFVPDYRRLLERGTASLAGEARAAEEAALDGEQRAFYRAVGIVCDGLERLAAPYGRIALQQAAGCDGPRRDELLRVARVCRRVPRGPATTLHEALQSLLFAQIALNLESLDNAISPGRLDQLLLPYYRADREAGRIDEARARELIGCFTVKMSEIVPVFSRRLTRFHGGLFNGQVVVVGGTDRRGRDATNELTWIFLDVMDRLRMRQPNYHARLHPGSPPAYVRRLATMLQGGSAAPALMNDGAVVPMLVTRGTDIEDARDYSPVGCVEPVACGATFGSTDAALVNLALCLERALDAGTPRSTAELVEAYRNQVDRLVDELVDDLHAVERANARLHPTPLSSMLLRGCLERGVDASAGGAEYNGSGVQGVGVADVADSLVAVDDVVFRRDLCDMDTLRDALGHDFAGHEALRGHLLRAPKYGNGDPRADAMALRVARIFAESLARHRNTRGGEYWAGFYSVTAHRAFGEVVGALPSGRSAGRALASGLSPSDGAERLGPTAALNSCAALEHWRWAQNGVNLNLKLDPTAVSGERGAAALEGLLRGYFDQGGMQVQVNVLDPQRLLEARDHPGRHPWLLVRVSGYSAYFDDLSPQMKQEIIDRTLHRG